MAIEALLLVPALFMFTSLIVYVGRITDASLTVRRTADMAARVASQSSAISARQRAIQSATNELRMPSSGCVASTVRVHQLIRQNQTVYLASITCAVNLSGLGLLGLLHRRVTAESTEVIDVYTAK
jgi:Flp pilus assembly protein TadG